MAVATAASVVTAAGAAAAARSVSHQGVVIGDRLNVTKLEAQLIVVLLVKAARIQQEHRTIWSCIIAFHSSRTDLDLSKLMRFE